MANLYKQYMRLLNKWPIDKTKGNDLGEHIRNEVKIAFSKAEATKINDVEKCKQTYEILNRLASNYYGNKYKYNFKKTASGIDPEVCSKILDKQFIKFLEEHKTASNVNYKLKHFFAKITSYFYRNSNKLENKL